MKYIMVGINRIILIIENVFELSSLECQYEIMINDSWKGILNSACDFVIFKESLGVSDRYKYIFAGKTTTNSTIINNDANFLVFLNNNRTPNIISKNPLIRTTSNLNGIMGGTISKKKLGFIKWFNPTVM